jgi:integrase
MPRKRLPLGTWGDIWTFPAGYDAAGVANQFEARAMFRDLDGVTRAVAARGKSKSAASNSLRERLIKRERMAQSGELKGSDRVSKAVELFMKDQQALVEGDINSPATLETYRYQTAKNILPRIGELSLDEATTPRVNRVIVAIKDEVGAASAKTCKSILAGSFALAVRYGALKMNPVREIASLANSRRKPTRALEETEREDWFELLRQDERAVKADLIDFSKFMIATGERIGECLAVTWRDLDGQTGEVDCSHQIQRIKGQGLIRRRVKSAAGDRILKLPDWALEMLNDRWKPGTSLDAPLFPDSVGGFRDPHNVSKALRDARRPIGSQRRRELGALLRQHRRAANLTQTQAVAKLGWPKTRVSLVETGRVRVEIEDAIALADAYRIPRAARSALLEATELAGMRTVADELSWVTSHKFRKTTATILEDAGQTPRQIADQLGHSRLSTTMDDYIGRKTRNPEAAKHLDDAMRSIHERDRQATPGPDI